MISNLKLRKKIRDNRKIKAIFEKTKNYKIQKKENQQKNKRKV
jgi:hypothetical protein